MFPRLLRVYRVLKTENSLENENYQLLPPPPRHISVAAVTKNAHLERVLRFVVDCDIICILLLLRTINICPLLL
jgi:hypothetical protein